MAEPTNPSEDVYEAAARAGNEANALTDRAILWPDDAWFRAAVDSAYAAGVAAGRAQAAADETLTCHLCDWPRPIDLDKHWHAVHLAKPEES